MTANADLVTATIADALLIPNAAIHADRAAGTYTVNVAVSPAADDGPAFTSVPVTVGLRDGSFTQITGGLDAGDAVLIGELNTAQTAGRLFPSR